MVKNRKLLEILATFTLYEVKNFKFSKGTVEFEYISIIKNIVCKCRYSKNYINLEITGDEWKRALPKNDIIVELSNIDKLREYIHEISESRFIEIDEGDNIIIEITHSKVSLTPIYYAVLFLDKVLLNLFLLIDNKELIGLEDKKEFRICLYPRFNDNTLVNIPIMSSEYIKYMGSYYRDFEGSAEYKSNGVLEHDGFDIRVVNTYGMGYTTYISYILNKNFITAIKLLKEFNICIDAKIKLCDNGDLVIGNPKNKSIYLNENYECDDIILIGRVIGDELIFNYPKDTGFKFSPLLLIVV